MNANGFFDARWGSSFEDVDPGYGTFLSNLVEGGWAVKNRIWSTTKFDSTDAMFNHVQSELKVAIHDKTFERISNSPCGREQGSFLRGSGIWERKACLYDKGFRRFTVSKIEASVRAGKPYVFDAGSRGGFASVVVVPKVPFYDYNPDQMRWLADIMFTETSVTFSNYGPAQE